MTLALRVVFLLFALLWVTQADSAARFAVCTTTCTWDNSSTAMWSATSGGATGQSAPTSADTVTLDAATCVGGVTCTITVNANLSINAFTMGACTASTSGCVIDFSANNNSITITDTFNNSGTGTRTLNMGNGAWVVNSSNANAWLQGTVTGLTFNANSSTLTINGSASAARAFQGGGKAYNSVTFNLTNATGSLSITGANSFVSLTLNGPQYYSWPNSTTQTITTLIVNSSSSSNIIGMFSNSLGTSSTLAVTNASSFSWAALRDMTFTTGTIAATSSFNLGNNTGITITAPATGGGGGRIIGG